MLRFRLLLLLLLPTTTTALTAAGDIAALSAFKSYISPSSIPPFSCLSSWNFSSDPCFPASSSHFLCGLSCSSSSGLSPARITAISLDAAGYAGKLLPLLSNLTLLSHLDLSDNSFYGSIPSSLSSLPSLSSLLLPSNSFSGEIPSSFSNLSSLTTLDFSRNSLSGELPVAISALSKLTTLDLSFNLLSGQLPRRLPPNLIELALKGNAFFGAISRSAFGFLRSIEVVELAGNRFGGKLGGWFLLLPEIQQVDLSNNSLNSIEVWPASGGGERLVAVDLSYNRIEGLLPASFAGYPALAALSARGNRLRGRIPAEYYSGKKGGPFRRLFLDGNFLKGKVPEGLLGDGVAGSFGDNCLESCPPAAAMCSPEQKPAWVCRQVYGDGKR